MGEGTRIPAYFPDFNEAETLKRWDGSIEAEAWAHMLRMRADTFRHVVVTTAVGLTAAADDAGLEHVDLEGLSAALWTISREEIVEIVNTHREEIARQVANLGEEGA